MKVYSQLATIGVPVEECCHKQDSVMRDDLCDTRTSTLRAINYLTVEIVDDILPFIDLKARYWLKIAIFAPVIGVPVGIFP